MFDLITKAYALTCPDCPGPKPTFLENSILYIFWILAALLFSNLIHGIIICLNGKKDKNIVKLGWKKIISSVIGFIVLLALMIIYNIVGPAKRV